MSLKWHWILQGQMYPIYVLLVPTSPKFHCVALYNQPFSRYKPLETNALNDPKMTLNLLRLNAPDMCVTRYVCICESQISVRFTLRPDVFEVQASLIQVHRMTPKSPWPPLGQMCPIYVLLSVPESQTSVHFALGPAAFWVTGHLEKSVSNDPPNRIEPFKLKYTPYVCN